MALTEQEIEKIAELLFQKLIKYQEKFEKNTLTANLGMSI